jgi:hypothetical protein
VCLSDDLEGSLSHCSGLKLQTIGGLTTEYLKQITFLDQDEHEEKEQLRRELQVCLGKARLTRL